MQKKIFKNNITVSFQKGTLFEFVLIFIPLLFLMIFVGIPLFITLILSFQEVNALQLSNIVKPFVGFGNYIAIFRDERFGLILANTFLFLFCSVFFQVLLGLLLSLAFSKEFIGATVFRGLFLIPWIMPQIVVGAIWSWVLQADAGILNYILRTLHIISQNIYWISDPNLALISVIIVNLWLGIPFNVIMLSTGLMDIPKEMYESASIDGAGPTARFFRITLPLMKDSIFAVISLGLIFTLQQFDIFQALTKGGPSDSSNVLQLWSWKKSFNEYEYGAGAATAILVILIMLIASVFYVLSTRKRNDLA